MKFPSLKWMNPHVVTPPFVLPRELKISTTVDDDGNVTQETDIFGDIRSRFFDLAAQQLDAGIRAGLIKLGWTPPATLPKSPNGICLGYPYDGMRIPAGSVLWRDGKVWVLDPSTLEAKTGGTG